MQLNNKLGYASGLALIQDKIPKAIYKVQPDLIGIGGICTDYHFLRDAIKVIRQTCNTPIVLGGRIVTNDREIFNILKPDYAIVGEADTSIVELVNLLSNEVKPTPFLMEGKTPDIDSLNFPDYDTFGAQEMIDDYSLATRLLYRSSREYPRPFNIVTARGCPFNCTFCVQLNHAIPYRARSIDSIMEEIRVSYEKYKFNILIILDELFVANKKRMREFCERLIEEKQKHNMDFDWMFQTHANAHLDKESLELAKKAGCYFFSYGLESASQRVLDSMHKKTKVEQAIEAVKLAEEAKVGFGGNLIFGDPAETVETILESLSVWDKYFRSSMVFLGHIQPYPGSELFDYCVSQGLIKDKRDYYEHIDERVYNMTSMSDGVYQAWLNLLNQL